MKVSLLNDDIGVHDALLVGDQESNKSDSIFNYEEDTELSRYLIVIVIDNQPDIED